MLPLEKQTASRHFRQLQPLVGTGAAGAARLTHAILNAWQERSFPCLVQPIQGTNKLAHHSLVVQFIDWLVDSDVLTGAFWLSSAYARWVGEAMRTERAMFFTPPSLSSRLIDNLIAQGASLTQDTWLDPASGGAAFLAPVALRMAGALRNEGRTSAEILEHIAKHLRGNDLDPCLADMSKQFLRMALYTDIQRAGAEPEFTITTFDALSDPTCRRAPVDVIICNPPYRKMPRVEVARYREHYDSVIVGQPNLYALFFKLALDILRPGGVAGLLTPTSYLSGSYFSRLRAYIRSHAEVAQLDIIDAVGAFIGVDQKTAITIMARQPGRLATGGVTQVFASSPAGGLARVGSCQLPTTENAWFVPRDDRDASLLEIAGTSKFHLSDYGFSAKVGAFVWNRDQRKTYPRDPNLKSGGVFPLIWSSDIGANGTFARRTGQSGQYVKMGRDCEGSVVRNPCAVLQRVTSSDQARRLIGAAVPVRLLRDYGGIVGENHVVILEQVRPVAAITPALLVNILQSETVDRLFRCISGAVNVSVYELNHLPLPSPTKLLTAMSEGLDTERAVQHAYGLHGVAGD